MELRAGCLVASWVTVGLLNFWGNRLRINKGAPTCALTVPFSLQNSGEPSRARTCDPLIKSQLLYQLSYRPTNLESKTISQPVVLQIIQVN